jgi:hypothetical protein
METRNPVVRTCASLRNRQQIYSVRPLHQSYSAPLTGDTFLSIAFVSYSHGCSGGQPSFSPPLLFNIRRLFPPFLEEQRPCKIG